MSLTPLPPLRIEKEPKHSSPLQLPSVEEGAAMARAGAATRNVYHEDYPVLREIAGEETPRLAALNAAVSANSEFTHEAHLTTQQWRNFVEWMSLRKQAGLRKPPTFEEALEEFARWRAKGQSNAMPTTENNVARALSAEDPGRTPQLLSGAKVDDYRLGRLLREAFPVDRHLARAYGVHGKLPTKLGEDVTGRRFEVPTSVHQQIGERAGQIVDYLNNGGGKWNKLQLQAAQWGLVRGVLIAAERVRDGYEVDPKAVLDSLTHERLGRKASLAAVLFSRDAEGSHSKAYRNLEQAGLGRVLKKIEKEYYERKEASPTPRGRVVDSLSRGDIEKLLGFLERMRPELENRRRTANRHKRLQRIKQLRLKFAAVEQPPDQAYQPMPAPPQAANPAQMGGQPASPAQLPPIDEHREHLLAFSPNVDDLSFEDALARSRAGNQKAFKKIVQHINEQIGLKAHLSDAIGDWSDGAENSILQTINEPVDQKTADYLASWYGLLANQKTVLAFTPLHGGLDSVYQVELPQTDLGQIRKSLDKAGIPFRTLVPSKKGTKVVIYDENRGLREQVAAWAGTHNATIRESIGQGRFIGGSTRTAARSEYRKIITAYEAAAEKSGGQVRAYRPTVLPNHLRSSQEKETPVRKARSGQVVRFAVDPMHDVSIPRDKWTVKGELDRIVGHFKDALHGVKETAKDAYRQAKRKKRRRKFAAGEQPTSGYSHEVVEAVKLHGGQYNHAPLHKVRQHLSSKGLRDRKQQDAAIRAARVAGHIGAAALEGRYSTPEEREAAIREGDSLLGYLHLRDDNPLRFSGVQAPAGGVVVRGLFYPGGKWIPSANLEKASYDQYQHVEKQRAKKYRRADGSMSVEGALATTNSER